ncbi:MFS transporter small subunit [Singulisphaera sp. PoT]|uniref:MFS transporter small subunit n=1 Tax=Singulisphaera sp. PoT TaxID=3411797 RepID=UPI003BF55693
MSRKSTSPIAIALAWIVVAIPLSWGVYQSLIKSRPLFQLKTPSQSLAPKGK